MWNKIYAKCDISAICENITLNLKYVGPLNVKFISAINSKIKFEFFYQTSRVDSDIKNDDRHDKEKEYACYARV